MAKPKASVATAEVVMWLLFVALLFPAGVVGWVVGHYTSGSTKTVTVTTSAAPASTTTAAATATAAATTTAAAAASTAGKDLFVSTGCGACHTLTAAGTSGTVGPNLDVAPEKDAKTTGQSLDTFVTESIAHPNAFISPGFPKGVMPQTYSASLGAAKISELVAFITAGK
jgi:mono/diheme cytochrome c family protein